MMYGNETLWNLIALPLRRSGVKVHYEGSIAKIGDNSDWDWYMYEDPERNNEWVLFDVEGSGCIYNFVQHRYPTSVEPTFRFYFDGETEPRFTIRHSEFGEKYPFVEPVASRYVGPVDNGRGPIRVVRSYVPMPFAHSCRITSDVKLMGNDKAKGEGGWGHVIYHTYADAANIKTFEITDDLTPVINLWKKSGNSDVIPFEKEQREVSSLTLQPGESKTVFQHSGAALISGIRILTRGYDKSYLKALTLKAYWNGEKTAALNGNFGCIFSNELGHHSVRYLLAGMSTDGEFYNNFPMPYANGAEIVIENNGEDTITIDYVGIRYTEEYNEFYRQNGYDVFRSSFYSERKRTDGKDSRIALIKGSGHMVSALITGYGVTGSTNEIASCEGDVRLHIDGIRTPQVESDGSESYSCYGWGFPTEPECNPASGYDGIADYKAWSETRLSMGDVNPFLSELRFDIESGGNNDWPMEHSGMVFYYGSDRVRLLPLAEISGVSEGTKAVTLTSYFEGDDDQTEVTLMGSYGASASFRVVLPENTERLILRRVSDQKKGRQRATVSVNSIPVTEAPWYFADSNPHKRWLEDEFVVPSRYIEGMDEVTVSILPEDGGDGITFNSFGYKVFAVLR